MQGRPVSPKEKALHDKIASMGCVACRADGIINTHVSIHHVHGRTIPGCHMHVLPLCDAHHQGNGTAVAVHVFKARFVAMYGKEDDLVVAQWAELGVEYKLPTKESRKELVIKSAAVERKQTRTKAKPQQKTASKASPLRKPNHCAKAELTASQLAYKEAAKENQKLRAKVQREAAKDWRAEREREYLEKNKDAIAAKKSEQKAAAKLYRQMVAAKKKQARA